MELILFVDSAVPSVHWGTRKKEPMVFREPESMLSSYTPCSFAQHWPRLELREEDEVLMVTAMEAFVRQQEQGRTELNRWWRSGLQQHQQCSQGNSKLMLMTRAGGEEVAVGSKEEGMKKQTTLINETENEWKIDSYRQRRWLCFGLSWRGRKDGEDEELSRGCCNGVGDLLNKGKWRQHAWGR